MERKKGRKEREKKGEGGREQDKREREGENKLVLELEEIKSRINNAEFWIRNRDLLPTSIKLFTC